MRIKLYFTLENTKLPIDYRRSIISFIKLSLSEYSENEFEKYYNQKDNIIKPYSFSIFFRQPQINGQEIILEEKRFEMNMTIENYETAITIYNAFNHQKNKKFSINQNSWILQNIVLIPEKEIKENKIIIKFQAPLCVRQRKENKDYYYSFENEEFEETLKMNIKEQLKIANVPTEEVDTFKIAPIKAKKVIIKFYEKQIECSTGIFKLEGDIELLNYLYKAGIGSKHSARIWDVSNCLKGGAKLKIKVYLNDWFFNAGIVGFLKILEENHDEFAIRRNNYIEFNTENLKNFHKYYFNYFFKKYNIAENVKNRTRNLFNYLENNIEAVFEDKDKEKERKDKIKLNKKYIKEAIKKQLDKIKKIDEIIYEEMKEQYEQIDKVNTKQEIVEIKEKLISNIEKENINKRLTLNLFKSILSNTYYGQPSFLNVVKTALSYEEQQKVMYKDYISNIVETGFINGIMQNEYSIEQVKEYIENSKERNITQDIEKIYLKIKKDYIDKSKTIEDIQKYLKEKVIKRCSMCENEMGLTTNYSEGNFVPLAISSNNAKNFFWNQNVNMPICDVCKLILFCIPAGMTTIAKTIKENGEYREKQLLSFVNYDTDINRLYKTNINFGNKSRYENKNENENPYSELILDIVDQDKQVSMWQLENIFVVEIEAEYGAYSRIEYFNIKRYMSIFFTRYAQKTLSKIWDYRYRLQIVDCIMKNKDIKYIINERLRDEMKKGEKKNGYNSFLAARIRTILNTLKKEGKEVEDIKKNDDKLYVIYNLGIQIHEELKHNNEDNKLDGYTYKMLNSVKAGNKKEFIDIVIRLHMAMGKDVSPIFIETMQTTGLDFESIGHSFLAGLISNKYGKKEEEKING